MPPRRGRTCADRACIRPARGWGCTRSTDWPARRWYVPGRKERPGRGRRNRLWRGADSRWRPAAPARDCPGSRRNNNATRDTWWRRARVRRPGVRPPRRATTWPQRRAWARCRGFHPSRRASARGLRGNGRCAGWRRPAALGQNRDPRAPSGPGTSGTKSMPARKPRRRRYGCTRRERAPSPRRARSPKRRMSLRYRDRTRRWHKVCLRTTIRDRRPAPLRCGRASRFRGWP